MRIFECEGSIEEDKYYYKCARTSHQKLRRWIKKARGTLSLINKLSALYNCLLFSYRYLIRFTVCGSSL